MPRAERPAQYDAPVISGHIEAGERLSTGETERVLEAFHRDGLAMIPGVLTRAEIDHLRGVTDRCFSDPVLLGTKYTSTTTDGSGGREGYVLRNTIELDAAFVDMLVREPILGLAEAVLGPDCAFCGQNVIRNGPGQGVETWHVDDVVECPLPDEVPHHDRRGRMPVQWFTIQIPLSDVDSDADGPTQFVPGSQYSGRAPASQEDLDFDGAGPVSVYCKAGDIYLHNNQTWHRGALVTGSRTRYLMQTQYQAAWAFRRFAEYNRVPVPDTLLSKSSERVRALLDR